jgi:hypothetical protein
MNDAREVTTSEGMLLAEHYKVPFMETSAKNSTNVEEAFSMLATLIK